jgi:hypothetical protein
MVASHTGLGSENDCVSEGQQQFYTTDPSSRQRKRPTSTNPQLSDSNKNVVVSPRWMFYSETDWLTETWSKHKTQTQEQRSHTGAETQRSEEKSEEEI